LQAGHVAKGRLACLPIGKYLSNLRRCKNSDRLCGTAALPLVNLKEVPMMRCLLLVLSLFLASPAFALSCMRPSVEAAFMRVHEAAEIYVPVLGQFTGFEPRKDSKSPTPEDRVFTAHFSGSTFTSRGKGRALDIKVAVTETCLASWCPHLPANTEMLTFLRRDGDGYAIEINACGGNAFSDPTPDQIKSMRACLSKMTCRDPFQ